MDKVSEQFKSTIEVAKVCNLDNGYIENLKLLEKNFAILTTSKVITEGTIKLLDNICTDTLKHALGDKITIYFNR